MEVESEFFSETFNTNLKEYQVCETGFCINKKEIWGVCYTKKPRVMYLVKMYLSDLHTGMQEARGKTGNLSDLLLRLILFFSTPWKPKLLV